MGNNSQEYLFDQFSESLLNFDPETNVADMAPNGSFMMGNLRLSTDGETGFEVHAIDVEGFSALVGSLYKNRDRKRFKQLKRHYSAYGELLFKKK